MIEYQQSRFYQTSRDYHYLLLSHASAPLSQRIKMVGKRTKFTKGQQVILRFLSWLLVNKDSENLESNSSQILKVIQAKKSLVLNPPITFIQGCSMASTSKHS